MSADPSSRGSHARALQQHALEFRARFGDGDGVRTFFAPGRVNLMGAHLDYNGGPVLPCAIDRGTFLAVRPRDDGRVTFASTLEEERGEFQLSALPDRARGAWFDYPLGVLIHSLEGRRAPHGMDVLFGGNLPIGAGLSSSASICVGSAFAFDHIWNHGRSRRDYIASALWGERDFVGVRCGIMDPFAVGFTQPGSLLWLDCKDESIEHLPLDPTRVAIAVADTGVRRELAQVAFNERVEQCGRAFEILAPYAEGATCLRDVPVEVVEEHAQELPEAEYKRALHVTREVRRTFAAREALLASDLVGFGARITEAHASLRDLFEVSIPELDALVEAATAWPGFLGGRLTGAGFGGCVVLLVERDRCEGFEAHLSADYTERFGRAPGVEFFVSDPGPREIELGG